MEMDLEEIPVVAEVSEDVLSDVFEDALAGFGMEESLFNDVNINEETDPLAAAFAHGLNSSPPPTENRTISTAEKIDVTTSPMTNEPANHPITVPPQGPPMAGPPQGPKSGPKGPPKK